MKIPMFSSFHAFNSSSFSCHANGEGLPPGLSACRIRTTMQCGNWGVGSHDDRGPLDILFLWRAENTPNLLRIWRRFAGSDSGSHQIALAIMADWGKSMFDLMSKDPSAHARHRSRLAKPCVNVRSAHTGQSKPNRNAAMTLSAIGDLSERRDRFGNADGSVEIPLGRGRVGQVAPSGSATASCVNNVPRSEIGEFAECDRSFCDLSAGIPPLGPFYPKLG